MPPVSTVFERDGTIFIVAPVMPITPSEEDIEEYAFSKAIRDQAPNPNLLWLSGRYVEADRPNENGAMWLSDELAVASLTPTLMPVTVMHDPSTAVGLIADTKLIPSGPDAVRARLDTSLAVWKHRFPDVADEIAHNYSAGSLMQSMECRPSHYDCADCGKSFPKLPGGAEKLNWCVHLKGEESAKAARILRGVCFTGTGLIFGTRGAHGAYDEAHLDVLQEEVAAFHAEAHETSHRPRSKSTRRNHMEISDDRYTELVAAEGKLKELEPKLATAEEAAAKVPELESKVETLEVEKKSAEDARDEEKTKREGLEEAARATTLSSERIGALGSKFTSKLPESVTDKLGEQAKTLTDDEWASRLDELAELVGVKADEKLDGEGDDGEKDKGGAFSREEVARSGAGHQSSENGGGNGQATDAKRRSVVAGLVKQTAKA